MSSSPYQSLEQEFRRHHALAGAASILHWDAAVSMPRGSAVVRGEQLAAIDAECHAILTAPRISNLLDRADASAGGLDDWQLANLREMRRIWRRANALPKRLVAAIAVARTACESAWERARAESDFRTLQPSLERLVGLVVEKSRRLGERLQLEPFAALVEEFDPDRSVAETNAIFAELTERLPGLVDAVIERQAAEPDPPPLPAVPIARQRELATDLMGRLGFSFDCGRLDESAHPMTSGTAGDVRVTTRYDERDLVRGLMAVLHETGHALYVLGLPEPWRTQPVGQDRGMTVHEAQALLMEMALGRSRHFCQFLGRLLAERLAPDPAWQGPGLLAHMTRVRRSLIRVDADELTYPLHIVLRHELEQQLLDGSLAVRDLPEAWNEGMRSRLGIAPANDRQGCLQDVHWPSGAFGYFCTYGLGAMVAAQLQQALYLAHPELPAAIEAGDFADLHGWLRENIHGWGAYYSTTDLLERATRRELAAGPYLDHLERRYLTG